LAEEITCFVENVGTKGVAIMNTQTAETMFEEYRVKVEVAANRYNNMCNANSGASFPALAAEIWRVGILAEIWGTIATLLNKTGVNHLDNWRTGQ
jgi:hypothetical protein